MPDLVPPWIESLARTQEAIWGTVLQWEAELSEAPGVEFKIGFVVRGNADKVWKAHVHVREGGTVECLCRSDQAQTGAIVAPLSTVPWKLMRLAQDLEKYQKARTDDERGDIHNLGLN